VISEQWTGKNVEAIVAKLKVLSPHVPWGTEENQENPVSGSVFEPVAPEYEAGVLTTLPRHWIPNSKINMLKLINNTVLQREGGLGTHPNYWLETTSDFDYLKVCIYNLHTENAPV
jgi:hypothetical protein